MISMRLCGFTKYPPQNSLVQTEYQKNQIGGSGGFLYGFWISAVIVSYLKDRINQITWLDILMLTILGTAIIISFGVAHLSYLYGFVNALEYGFYPFWKATIIKIVLATFSYFLIIKIAKPNETNIQTS